MTSKILVIDDDRKTVELVKLYLENDGFYVFSANDGKSAVRIAREQHPDLIVLDLMIPKMDGIEVCREIRSGSDVPIIMLTARTTEEDKLLGLNLGADDYITKPFSPREVLARVKAVLRRVKEMDGNGRGPGSEIELNDLTVYPEKHEARIRGEQLVLTPKEFQLLELFARFPGRAFSRKELIAQAFGQGYIGIERTIDVHVMNLRKKMEVVPDPKVRIKTVYGVGYKLIEA